MNELAKLQVATTLPALVLAAGPKASTSFLEFFASHIRNRNTRRAYTRAVAEFLAWCEAAEVATIVDVEPLHVAAWIEKLTRDLSAPTAKQHLAAVRMLFDWRPILMDFVFGWVR